MENGNPHSDPDHRDICSLDNIVVEDVLAVSPKYPNADRFHWSRVDPELGQSWGSLCDHFVRRIPVELALVGEHGETWELCHFERDLEEGGRLHSHSQ